MSSKQCSVTIHCGASHFKIQKITSVKGLVQSSYRQFIEPAELFKYQISVGESEIDSDQ